MNKSLILVLNCGSSSIKFAIVDAITGNNYAKGLVQCIGTKDANISWQIDINKQNKSLPHINYQDALDFILNLIHTNNELYGKIFAIGHRVVHGGEYFAQSTIIDGNVINKIRECQQLAPLHNPANILGIEACNRICPEFMQVAVFDTAFHQTMPEVAFLYAIPFKLYTEHKIRRYGFHGTSHRYVAQEAANILGKPLEQCNLITAHLGNGCSICAIHDGKSVDTSMGLTPLEGLVMGTRSGDVDPSLHAHLTDTLGYDIHKINNLLNKQSGLLGISGLDSDMRTIEAAIKQGNELAILAGEIFCYRLAKYIGAYAIPLGHIDALVFTGGIGENSPYVREKVISWLKILNFTLDKEKNDSHGKDHKGIITTQTSAIALVIPTNEELLIAKDTLNLITTHKTN